MGTSTLVPLSEYLSTDYSPDCDYVDGVLEDRNVGEKDHGRLQAVLISLLVALEKKLGIHVTAAQRVQISASPTSRSLPSRLSSAWRSSRLRTG